MANEEVLARARMLELLVEELESVVAEHYLGDPTEFLAGLRVKYLGPEEV